MARRIYDFDAPDRFLAGTVGPPGRRTFFLQARQGSRLVSVVLEKVQLAALADRIAAILAEIARRSDEALPDFTAAAPEVLDEPVQEAFRVGTLALAWDPEDRELVVEAREETDDDEDEEPDDDDTDGPDLVRVRLRPDDARSFVAGAAALVAAGRPPCPVCGQPLNPEGHICARRNGYVN